MYHSFYISYLIPQLIFHSNSAWGTFIEIVAPFKYFTHVISKKSCAYTVYSPTLKSIKPLTLPNTECTFQYLHFSSHI